MAEIAVNGFVYNLEATPLQPVQPDTDCLCRQAMMEEAFRPRPTERVRVKELAEDFLAYA